MHFRHLCTYIITSPQVCIHTVHSDEEYLLGAVDEDAVQDEVGPEQRPLTLDVLKQLQLCRLVIQAVWILQRKLH